MAPHHRDNDTSMETILNYDNRDAVRYILIVLDLHVGVAVQLYYYYKFFVCTVNTAKPMVYDMVNEFRPRYGQCDWRDQVSYVRPTPYTNRFARTKWSSHYA